MGSPYTLGVRRSVDQDAVDTLPAPVDPDAPDTTLRPPPPLDEPAGEMLRSIALGELDPELDEGDLELLEALRDAGHVGADCNLTKAGLEALVRYEAARGRFGAV